MCGCVRVCEREKAHTSRRKRESKETCITSTSSRCRLSLLLEVPFDCVRVSISGGVRDVVLVSLGVS